MSVLWVSKDIRFLFGKFFHGCYLSAKYIDISVYDCLRDNNNNNNKNTDTLTQINNDLEIFEEVKDKAIQNQPTNLSASQPVNQPTN